MKVGLVALLMMSCAVAAQAAPRCYLPKEIEADEAVQFQTELMVVSNTCRAPSYTDFTRHNRTAIIAYQHELIEHFRRNGERNAETAFETYLTHLANESSLRNGKEAPASLCAHSAEMLTSADALGPEEFRRLAASRAADHGAAYRRCRG